MIVEQVFPTHFVNEMLFPIFVFCSVSDDDVSLEGLEEELQDYKSDDVCVYQFSALY